MIFLNFLYSKTTILLLDAEKKKRKRQCFWFFFKFLHNKTTKIAFEKNKKEDYSKSSVVFSLQVFCDYHWIQGCNDNLPIYFLFFNIVGALYRHARSVSRARPFKAARVTSHNSVNYTSAVSPGEPHVLCLLVRRMSISIVWGIVDEQLSLLPPQITSKSFMCVNCLFQSLRFWFCFYS